MILERDTGLWKEISANWSILARFCCTDYIILKETSNEKVFNYKVVEDLKIYLWTQISSNLELSCSSYVFLKWKEIKRLLKMTMGWT